MANMRTDTPPQPKIRVAFVIPPGARSGFAPGEVTVKFDMGPDSNTLDGHWASGDEFSPAFRDDNLGGTISSWNEVDPANLHLQKGLLSRAGWAVLNDLHTTRFDTAPKAKGTPWLGQGPWWAQAPRQPTADLYLFACGRRYTECLGDYAAVGGPIPLLPRSAYGTWWSHYEPYSASTFVDDIMAHFQNLSLPLNAFNLDVDWHNRVGKPPKCMPFNGFDWNASLFPDHAAFASRAHDTGFENRVPQLQFGLNTHLFDGVDPCESPTCYATVARSVGLDPTSPHKMPIPLNLTNAALMTAIFESCIADTGADWIWLDGSLNKWAGTGQLDSNGAHLLWNVHLHDTFARYYHGGRRPITLARFGGMGQHRYAMGFSGDALANWDTLRAQINMTSKASNVLFSHWSHDIGGFKLPDPTPELYVRWAQFGIVSPLWRSHGTKGSERRYWKYGARALAGITAAMRLRVAISPYLYTQDALVAHVSGVGLLRPMYYSVPGEATAYQTDLQYMVGSALLARPVAQSGQSKNTISSSSGDYNNEYHSVDNNTIAAASDDDTIVLEPGGGAAPVAVDIYLPSSRAAGAPWVDFVGGRPAVPNNSTGLLHLEAPLELLPLYASVHAIVPMLPYGTRNVNDIAAENARVIWAIFGPSAEGQLYEDDGNTTAYEHGHGLVTQVRASTIASSSSNSNSDNKKRKISISNNNTVSVVLTTPTTVYLHRSVPASTGFTHPATNRSHIFQMRWLRTAPKLVTWNGKHIGPSPTRGAANSSANNTLPEFVESGWHLRLQADAACDKGILEIVTPTGPRDSHSVLEVTY